MLKRLGASDKVLKGNWREPEYAASSMNQEQNTPSQVNHR